MSKLSLLKLTPQEFVEFLKENKIEFTLKRVE